MISFEEALATIRERAHPLGVERVPLREALGRYLAEDIHSPHDVPFYDNSAVDGYAIRASDLSPLPAAIPVAGEVKAGDEPLAISGGAVRVFTGSAIPPGCDAVAMQEFVAREGEMAHFNAPATVGQHIRRKGEEIKLGEKVAEARAPMTPSLAALLASLGLVDCPVWKLPRVAVVGTGSELVRPGKPLREGQIYESNTLAIESALRCMGIPAVMSESVADDEPAIREALAAALETSDVVITCGGVSVGDHDLVLPVIESLGCEKVFWKVAIKPGKPFLFAAGPRGQMVFGLPGNPVSVLATFYALVRPALLKMVGAPPEPAVYARLGKRISKQPGRHELVRGRLSADGPTLVATPVHRQGSHMLTGISAGDCLIHAPAASECIGEGEVVEVTKLTWSLI